MHQKTSIKKNFAYQMIYQVLVWILPLITSPYVARVIGAEGIGIYSYSYSIAYYFVLFSMLGLANYGNRAIAQCNGNQEDLDSTFSSIFAVHFIVSLICLAAYEFYVFALCSEPVYAFIQTAYVLSGMFDISWFYFGIEKFKLTVLRSTVIKIINAACIFIFVHTQQDLWIYCLIMALGMLANQVTLWLPLRKFVRIRKPTLNEMRPHIKPMLVLFVPAIAISLYKYMDKIMIGAMSSKEQLGFYENAEKMVNVPLMMITSFGTVMLPRMSNLMALRDMKNANRYISLSMKYIMCLAFALSLGLASIGRVFAPIFWGSDFSLSGSLITGLSITIPFISFANIIRTQYLIPTEKDREYLISVCVGAVVNLIINTLLIPNYGATGATIGTIAAEITVCILQALSVRKELALKEYTKSFAPFLGFAMLMLFAVYFTGKFLGVSFKTLFVQIFMGIFIYGGLCFAYFYKTDDPILSKVFARLHLKGKRRA